MSRISSLIISIALAFFAGYIGSLYTSPAIDFWYATLEKPLLNPPNWIFGPVWSVLYLCMAVAAWRVWVREGMRALPSLVVYAIQLVLNTSWSIVFFARQDLGAALVIIVVLLAFITATAIMFYRTDRLAGYLFIPYGAWVAFATYLNTAIFMLNR